MDTDELVYEFSIKCIGYDWTYITEEPNPVPYYEYHFSSTDFKKKYLGVIYIMSEFTEILITPEDNIEDEIYHSSDIEACVENSSEFADGLAIKIFNSPCVKTAIFEYEKKN